MKFNILSLDLCRQAAWDLYDGKWSRSDILAFTEEMTGIAREELWAGRLNNDLGPKVEVIDSIALYLLDLAEDIIAGKARDDVLPVRTEERYDNMAGKYRTVATLSIPHQLLGHLAKLGLDPLFRSSLLPTQHASIPGRGQTGMLRHVKKALRKSSNGITYCRKTDVTHAYGSVMYARMIEIIKEQIPRAKWLFPILEFLGRMAPDGHLIIGGYLDAWLFNYAMSFVLRFIMRQGYYRRGKFIPYVVKIETYMDDFILLGSSQKGLTRIVGLMNEFMCDFLQISCRPTTKIIRLLNVEKEHARKKLPKPSQRGCPAVDAAGFKIHRTHVTMRGRVAKRVIRTYSRAYRELQETGTIQIQQSRSVMARWGSLSQTDNYKFCEKYHVYEVNRVAKKVIAYHDRSGHRRRKERMQNAVNEYRKQCDAGEGPRRS